MADLATIAAELSTIGTHLGAIRGLIEQSQAQSQSLQTQAEEVLAAHAQSAQTYLAELPAEPAADYFPFETVPPGTLARDLPAGGRMFELSDGCLLRWSVEEVLAFIDLAGNVEVLSITGRELTLPNGMNCTIKTQALHVTHEAAGIAGLPLEIEPRLIAERCYASTLPDGTWLFVNHADRTAVLVTPIGTILVLGHRKAAGIGEKVELSPISTTGDWAFGALTSGHRGVLHGDGTIELMTAGGLDLEITFPPPVSSGGDGTESPLAPCDACGLEHM